jgi:transcriptional regulator with XRE-family HTH domain
MSDNPALTQWLTQPDGLAARLRAIRLQAGLNGRSLATRLGWGPYKVSRLENGRQLPTRAEVEQWVAACGDHGALGALIDLLGEAASARLTWRARLARGERDPHAAYDRLLEHTTQLAAVAVAVVPDLLQTAAYARSLLASVGEVGGTSPAEVERAVTARVQRHCHLRRKGRWYEFVIAESVLRCAPCPPADMVDQLRWLREVAALPNVVLRVLPARAGVSAPPVNSFEVYDSELVLVESFVGEQEHHADEAAAAYRRALLLLREASVAGDDADGFLRAAIDQHEHDTGWRASVAV